MEVIINICHAGLRQDLSTSCNYRDMSHEIEARGFKFRTVGDPIPLLLRRLYDFNFPPPPCKLSRQIPGLLYIIRSSSLSIIFTAFLENKTAFLPVFAAQKDDL